MTRHAAVALTVFVAWLALLPAHAAAQDRGGTPAPQELWKAYPLDQGAAATAQPTAAASPTAGAGMKREPLAAAAQRDEAGAPVIVLALLVLLAAGGAMTFRWTRRGGKHEPLAAEAAGPRAYTMVEREPGRPQGGSGRFTPVTARNRGVRATAAVGGSPRARGGSHEPEESHDWPVTRRGG